MYFTRLPTLALFILSTCLLSSIPVFAAPGEPLNRLSTRLVGSKTSKDPKVWPSLAQLQKILGPKPGQIRYFWTGQLDGVSVENRAAAIAAANGGVTIDLMFLRSGVTMPPFGDTKEGSLLWVEASKIYAQGASGTTFCIQGNKIRPNNTFVTAELPILRANKAVTSNIKVDGKTCAESILFQRSKLRRDVEKEGIAEREFEERDDNTNELHQYAVRADPKVKAAAKPAARPAASSKGKTAKTATAAVSKGKPSAGAPAGLKCPS